MLEPVALNFLPPEKQRRLRHILYLIIAKYFLSIVLIALAFGGTILLAGQYFAQRTFEEIAFQIALVTKEYTPINSKIRALNMLLRAIDIARAAEHPWSMLFTDLTARAPSGIRFTSLTLRENGTVLTIQGRAAERDDLIQFEAMLKRAPFIDDLARPLENLLERTDVPFTIEATVEPARIPRSLAP